MPIKFYNPTSAGRRAGSVLDYNSVLTKDKKPEKSLSIGKRRAHGRNHHGVITAKHRGGNVELHRVRRAGQMTLLFDATGFARCRMYRNAEQLWEGLCKNATEGMAKPAALPVWSVILAGGQVLPAILLLTAPTGVAALALACGIGTRLLLAVRFRQPVLSALLQPVGIAALLVVQWFSLLRAARGGRATWRGRAYPAQ